MFSLHWRLYLQTLAEVSETSDTATSADKAVPLEPQAASTAAEETGNSAAADQDNQEIDIEEDNAADDIPMELTTPLSSGSELNLSFESELVDDKTHQDKLSASSEVATIKQDDETMDVDVVGEAGAVGSNTPRTERVDSVQIDPSFKPESEELLYEGDVENDGDVAKSVPPEGQPSATAAATSTTTHEEGFVLAVDDTFATDLDEAHSGKSPPKKHESSKTKSDGKSSSKAPLSSGESSQNTKAKSEGGAGSSTTSAAATSNGSSSKHPSKDAGKPASSGSTETTPSARFV